MDRADFLLAKRGGTEGLGMTGKMKAQRGWLVPSYALCCTMILVACGETGGPGSANGGTGMNVLGQSRGLVRTEEDVERADIFSVTDRGLWDGRPSLGGVWVAHPDVRDPERVVIRNAATGESVIGALFRRERNNPGPAIQISSDAAEQLGILAGAPTELSVVALRRVEVTVAAPATEDTDATGEIAALAAPEMIEATPLDPVAGAQPAATVPDQGPVEVVLPPAPVAAAPQDPVAAAAVDGAPLPAGASAQIGIFSVRANADAAAATLTAAGFTASVSAQQAGGRSVWRVVAGPVPDQDALARIKALGFVDAFLLTTQ
jgi:rare lipoprotein A